jgi:hypothetical protein
MNCPYRYKENDEPVKAGTVKIGDVCGLRFGVPEWGGLCPAHARTEKVIPQQELEASKAKREETIRKKKAEPKNDPGLKVNTPGEAERHLINETVLDAMGLKEPCDLETEVALFRALNNKPTYVNYDEKMAFARWLESPIHLRKPQSMKEAAVILGVTYQTLQVWKISPEVIDFINSDVESRIGGLYKLALYKLGVNIDRGDVRSIDTFLKYYGEKRAEKNKSRKSLNLPQELQKEADDYARSSGERNRNASLTSEKSMVNRNFFSKTDNEELEQ